VLSQGRNLKSLSPHAASRLPHVHATGANVPRSIAGAVVIIMLGWSCALDAASSGTTAMALDRTPPDAAPGYQPRFPEAPRSRVGSVTRGAAGAQDMMVLAPDRKGASATDQPTLFWYLPANTARRVEVVVQQRGADEPLLELQLKTVLDRPIGALALADHGIHLTAGVEYEWSVALIEDPERRSHDVFSMGSVEFIPPDAPTAMAVESAVGPERVRLLLNAGYWYDALLLLQSGANAGDRLMTAWQKALLRNEGLLADRGSDPAPAGE